ncbi:MAG: imidazole glycerol phosphate synthase subunit HisH [Chloroflexi bacterium]|nr:imidazole glycerol phosphate synthase subunit HisH [Chloroflexota bacterium]
MTHCRVAVIDYGAGNLRSVTKALEAVGGQPSLTSDPQEIQGAQAVLLPGVGACDAAMEALKERGLTGAVRRAILSGTPFFGVCLGLQLLFEASEEGAARCLGIFRGQVRRFSHELKVPHMGWNQVHFDEHHPVFADVPQDSYFYFVHSYYADPGESSLVVGTTSYGAEFCSAVAWGNLIATQFHPEKSGAVGLQLYRNFLTFAEKTNALREQYPQ